MALFREVFVVSRGSGHETVGGVLENNERGVVVASVVECLPESWTADRRRNVVVVIREKPKNRDVNFPNGIDRVVRRIQENPILATRPLVDQRKIIRPRIATTLRLHCGVVFIGRCAARQSPVDSPAPRLSSERTAIPSRTKNMFHMPTWRVAGPEPCASTIAGCRPLVAGTSNSPRRTTSPL